MTATRHGIVIKRLLPALGLLAAACFAALSLSPNSATRFYQWPWFFYWQMLLIAPIAILAGRLLATRRPLPRFGSGLDAGLLLVAATSVVAALFSPFRPQSLNAALIPVAAVSLAYTGLDWIGRDANRRTERNNLLDRLTGALMLLFVVASLGSWLFLRLVPALASGGTIAAALAIRNADPLGHSVYTAGFAVLCAPWLTALGLTARGWLRAAWFAAAGLAVALVPTTASRGGVIAFAATLACAAALWLVESPLSRARRGLVVVGVLAAAGVLAGLDPRLRDLVLHGRWSRIASESNIQREAMLKAGWLMGRDRPWTGYGPGTISLVYPRYRPRLSGGVEDVLQLHNTPVQIWAELGMPGVIALACLAFGGLRLARDSRKQHPIPFYRLRMQAAFTACAGYAVMCLFDYQLDVPLFAAVVAMLLVVWRATAMDGEKVVPAPAIPLRVARPVGVALVLALAAMLWPTLSNLRARQTFAHAADARVAGDEAAFVAGAEKAAAIAPWESFYLTQLAAFFGDQYLQAPDATARTRALDRCRALLRQALAINPDQEYCHFNLGWLLLPEDPAAAEKHLRAAARFSPYRGGVYLGAGLSRFAQNERSAAADAFALEWLNDPQALASPRWHTPPLAALRSEVTAALHRLADRWGEESALSAAAQRQVDYVVGLADWWSGAMVDASPLIRLGSAEQQRFFRSLPAIEQRTYAPTDAGGRQPWEELYLAWRDKAAPSGLAAKEPSFAAALTRRISATPVSFARVLTAPPDGDSSLIQYRRNERPGYGVLERNQDGFLLRDLYIFPQNLLVEKYASFLFPPKGYLPTGLLLRSLDQVLAGPP